MLVLASCPFANSGGLMSLSKKIQEYVDAGLITLKRALALTVSEKTNLEAPHIKELIDAKIITSNQAINLTFYQNRALEDTSIRQRVIDGTLNLEFVNWLFIQDYVDAGLIPLDRALTLTPLERRRLQPDHIKKLVYTGILTPDQAIELKHYQSIKLKQDQSHYLVNNTLNNSDFTPSLSFVARFDPESVSYTKQYGKTPWICSTYDSKLVCVTKGGKLGRIISKSTSLPWSEIPGDYYSACETSEKNGLTVRHCIGKKTTLVEYGNIRPSLVPALGSAALQGALYAALPEAVGDALYLSGRLSQSDAEYVKWVINLALLFTTGSYLSAGAACFTRMLLGYAGCSKSQTTVAGNSVAFLVNIGKNMTFAGVAATSINYLAGKAGFWAEKQIAQRFSKNGFVNTQLHPGQPHRL